MLRRPHLLTFGHLPSHNPLKYVSSDWHVEDAAWEDTVSYSVILPISERNADVRGSGAARAVPDLAGEAMKTFSCTTFRSKISSDCILAPVSLSSPVLETWMNRGNPAYVLTF